eukprot:CAMPEP_0184370634 /NCGR_PEP_ID=MMETSP1089-20130417/162941_1 /TAXON_ID=38269 ORGANISM="Gloeochaete wittrockiana, Strain SAG46.84" /NCGR_SAMPLE_ID=MMETSP1089 /ASSEMBLY_ACC=CAM_ASM_000445 /LENGTH=779 /DNA_ID=CAMNT_0026713279 /DNA_START=331 /DNA_END=2670 /DNA_ORIENTATION=-
MASPSIVNEPEGSAFSLFVSALELPGDWPAMDLSSSTSQSALSCLPFGTNLDLDNIAFACLSPPSRVPDSAAAFSSGIDFNPRATYGERCSSASQSADLGSPFQFSSDINASEESELYSALMRDNSLMSMLLSQNISPDATDLDSILNLCAPIPSLPDASQPPPAQVPVSSQTPAAAPVSSFPPLFSKVRGRLMQKNFMPLDSASAIVLKPASQSLSTEGRARLHRQMSSLSSSSSHNNDQPGPGGIRNTTPVPTDDSHSSVSSPELSHMVMSDTGTLTHLHPDSESSGAVFHTPTISPVPSYACTLRQSQPSPCALFSSCTPPAADSSDTSMAVATAVNGFNENDSTDQREVWLCGGVPLSKQLLPVSSLQKESGQGHDGSKGSGGEWATLQQHLERSQSCGGGLQMRELPIRLQTNTVPLPLPCITIDLPPLTTPLPTLQALRRLTQGKTSSGKKPTDPSEKATVQPRLSKKSSPMNLAKSSLPPTVPASNKRPPPVPAPAPAADTNVVLPPQTNRASSSSSSSSSSSRTTERASAVRRVAASRKAAEAEYVDVTMDDDVIDEGTSSDSSSHSSRGRGRGKGSQKKRKGSKGKKERSSKKQATERVKAAAAKPKTTAAESLPSGAPTFAKEELAKYFDLPIADVATRLGVCVTILKKNCRSLGIDRWPHRKIKSLQRWEEQGKEVVRSQLPEFDHDAIRETIVRLHDTRLALMHDPNGSIRQVTCQIRRLLLLPVQNMKRNERGCDLDPNFDTDLSRSLASELYATLSAQLTQPFTS